MGVHMGTRFVSDPLRPITVTCDTSRMAIGEPGLPREFHWRDRKIGIAAVISTWRETGDCRHGSGEQYVRRHWYEVLTTEGATAKIYFERQPPRGRKRSRWVLFTLREPEGSSPETGDGGGR